MRNGKSERRSVNDVIRDPHHEFPDAPAPVKVLVVGQTPPPHGGKPIMIGRLVCSQLPGVELLHARIGFSDVKSDVSSFRWWKTVHLLAWIARIIWRRIVRRVNILYYSPGGPNRLPMYRDLAILLSTRWMFTKTIFHFHAGGVSQLYDQLPRWQRWLFRRAYFHPDAAIRLSELTPEDGRQLGARREYMIPNGIDDPCPNFSRTVADRSPLRLLYVGMLCESKGLLVLIEACGRLAARGVAFQLDMMGQWQCEEFAVRLRARIAELNLECNVRFLGVLTGAQKFAAYEHADVFCFPTFFECETFGIVLLEAMAFGLPVVATHWRGIPSIVEDGETGYLVEPHDAEAVAERLECLASDPQLRFRLGTAGREKFEREYTWSCCAERMRQMFLEVAGAAPAVDVEAIEEPCTAIPS